MPSYNTEAIVLRRFEYGETDRILTLFSREHGKIRAIAKGARKALSRFSGVSQVLTRARVQLGVGKSLDVVSQCEIISGYPGLRHDLIRLAHGLYLVDLIDHATEDRHPNPELYDLLAVSLEALETAPNPELLARWFEVRLLDDLGYTPDLSACTFCQCPIPGDFPDDLVFGLSISLGSIVCPDDLSWDVDSDQALLRRSALELLTRITDCRDVSVVLRIPADPADLLQIESALRPYMRYRLERELKSLPFLDSVTKGIEETPTPEGTL